MNRKQLQTYFNVKIYQEPYGYVVILPEGQRVFKYMSEVEKFLEERERRKLFFGDN